MTRAPQDHIEILRAKGRLLRRPLIIHSAREPMVSCVRMTKVEVSFGLTRRVTEPDMEAISRAHAVYGIQAVRLAPPLDSIIVDYDASRLSEARLEAALVQCGVPLKRKDIPVGPTS